MISQDVTTTEIFFYTIMLQGKVIFYNKKSKFGFIKDNQGNLSYYVNGKHLKEILETDDKVEFEWKDSKKGKEAFNIKKIK